MSKSFDYLTCESNYRNIFKKFSLKIYFCSKIIPDPLISITISLTVCLPFTIHQRGIRCGKTSILRLKFRGRFQERKKIPVAIEKTR